jgi:glucose/arabinose dehydrogenase
MKVPGRVVPCALLLAAVACGGNDGPPSPGPGPGPGGDPITGNERLGWTQTAASPAELATFRYAIYVDGARSEIADSSCSPLAGAFACSGRLPSMTPGRHTIEVATFLVDGDNVVESPRSEPITVLVGGVLVGPGDPASSVPASVSTADGVRLAVDQIAAGLDRPTAIVRTADGRVFVAEHAGRILTVRPGAVGPGVAYWFDDVLAAGDAGGLLDLAIDPDFDRTGFVFAVYTAANIDGSPVFRLARLRDAGGTLGERAVLVDDIPASFERTTAAIRFGPDGRLYVALDDGGRPATAERAASYNGKVLRLNPDGSTPDDRPAFNPVHAAGLRAPSGLDWHPDTGTMWVVDARPGDPRVAAFTSDRRGLARTIVRLPAAAVPDGARFFISTSIPEFDRDLLVAAGDALVRLTLPPADGRGEVLVERLLEGAPGSVRALTVGDDGAIYVGTASSLLRLRPE